MKISVKSMQKRIEKEPIHSGMKSEIECTWNKPQLRTVEYTWNKPQLRKVEGMWDKSQLRKIYRSKRKVLSEEQAIQWSEAICRRLTDTELFQKAEVIYFYYPLGNEVSLLPAAQAALDAGKCIGFPRTEGDVIRFYKTESLTDFREGCFHVMEPTSSILLWEEKPLILIPGLVFDHQKNRMGYGKGYYDRYMANVPDAVKVGVAYEMQLLETIPTDSYDIPMDYLITEERIW